MQEMLEAFVPFPISQVSFIAFNDSCEKEKNSIRDPKLAIKSIPRTSLSPSSSIVYSSA